MMIIGDKTRFAFDIGLYWNESKQHQHITIWSAGQPINPIDDVVYLPSFYTKLQNEIRRLEKNDFGRPDLNGLHLPEIFKRLDEEENELRQVLCYDVSTSPARCFFLEQDSGGVLLWSYWDSRHFPSEETGSVFSLDISKEELLDVLKGSLDNLSDVWV